MELSGWRICRVGLELVRHLYRGLSIRCDSDDLDPGFGRERSPHELREEGFVIDDQDTGAECGRHTTLQSNGQDL